jgi:hypothetical protein
MYLTARVLLLSSEQRADKGRPYDERHGLGGQPGQAAEAIRRDRLDQEKQLSVLFSPPSPCIANMKPGPTGLFTCMRARKAEDLRP